MYGGDDVLCHDVLPHKLDTGQNTMRESHKNKLYGASLAMDNENISSNENVLVPLARASSIQSSL